MTFRAALELKVWEELIGSETLLKEAKSERMFCIRQTSVNLGRAWNYLFTENNGIEFLITLP
jgi:hypothetical protein